MRLTGAVTAFLATRSVSSFSIASSHLLSHRFSFRSPSYCHYRMNSVKTATATTSFALSDASREALIACPTIPLSDGTLHPAIGFGTYKVGFMPASASAAATATATTTSATPQPTAEECIANALDCGYRFLECAEFYGNEAQVGKAIAASGIDRNELFLCSKVWTSTIEKGPDAIRAQLEKTLADLGTDHVDLYLIHWPVPGKHVEAYKTLELLKKEGKIKGLGVSNYALEDYLELKQSGIEFPPLVNQIEINPFLYRKKTIQAFQKEGVVLQAYRSLRDGKVMNDPTLLSMAGRYEKTVAQLLGRWCTQHGFVHFPKSVKKDRMVENALVFDFVLSDEDMSILDNLTTPSSIDAFVALYRKCVNRDTTKDGTLEGVKMNITED